MEIYIFDRQLNLQGILGSYFSFRWVRKYSKCGDFELHCALTPESVKLLKKGNVIWKNNDLEAGYIEYRKISLNTKGDEILVVKGKFLTGYISRRIIWGIENYNTASELAIRDLIDKNCINPIDVDRVVDLLELEAVKGFTQTVNTQTSYANVLDKVESIANTSELGIRTLIDLENKKMLFDIYEGLDRTASQSINPPAIFSQEFENILSQEYTESESNYKNVVLIAGEGEGIERELATVGQGIGLDRFELFVDARDLQKEEMTTEQYIEKLEGRGSSRLAESVEIQNFDSKINLNSNLTYKEDFDLGDQVTCTSKRWGVTIDTKITEIEEVYEGSGFSVNVVFGDNMPTIIDKIKQVVRQ